MKMIFSLLLAAFAFDACAEVVIYQHRFTAVVTGGGKITRLATTGYTVFDPRAGDEPVMVLARITPRVGQAPLKSYSEYHPDGVSVSHVSAAPTVSYTVFSQVDSWVDSNGKLFTDVSTIKGVNPLIGLTLGTNSIPPFSYRGPRVMTCISRATGPANPAFPFGDYLEETTGTLTLDIALSKVANNNKDTVAAAVRRVRTLLESQGYIAQ